MSAATGALARWWLPAFIGLGVVFVGLPIAAPLLAMRGNDQASALIYVAYRVTCHQLPHHSWFLGGNAAVHDQATVNAYYGLDGSEGDLALLHQPIRDPELGYQMAFCQRDTAIHMSLLVTAILFALAGRWSKPLRWRWYALALVPIAIDGGTGLIGLRESTPLLRTLTGALFGAATALLVLPYLEQGFRDLGVGGPPGSPAREQGPGPSTRDPKLGAPVDETPRPDSPAYRLLIGTHNPAKFNELSTYLASLALEHGVRLELVSPADVGILEAVPESGATFEEISEAKARAYFDACNLPSIADDGGLEIAALDGAPGVRSRRWLGEKATDDESLIRYTLQQMSSLEGERRAARLRTCITFWDGVDMEQECRAVPGTIALQPSERRVVGYPYRSLFVVDGLGRYYDELTPEEHVLVNHRRKAMHELFARAILPSITRTTAPPGR